MGIFSPSYYNDDSGSSYNSDYSSNSYNSFNYSSHGKPFTPFQSAQLSHQYIGHHVTTSRQALIHQDKVVAQTAYERAEAQKIYEQKKSNHIMAKKDRAAINKNVRHSESAFRASGRKILALNRMSNSSPIKSQKLQADIDRAGNDIQVAMESYDYSMMGQCFRQTSSPIKIEEDEDEGIEESSDEDCDDERDGDYYPQRSPRPGLDGRMRDRYGRFC